jgi:hypothetical protein
MRLTPPLVAAALALAPVTAHANEGGITMFVRGDTDQTTVVSPRATVGVGLDEDRTRFDVAYMADVWTSASIDIRTAATVPVTEQRDQIDAAASRQIDDVNIGASYYLSGEADYWSHGVSLFSRQEILGKCTTLEERATWSHDTVGRSGDPAFSRPLDTGSLRLGLTQILTPQMIVQAVWEGAYRVGYQSSPYRFVGLGGDGQCGGSAVLCVPEANPDTRLRNAIVLHGRYSLSPGSSLGLGYRLYFDDWGVNAHTVTAQVAWLPSDVSTITLRYRFYLQSAAGFYRSAYPLPAGQLRYATRDRELSPMFSNRVALSYETKFELADDITLGLALALGGTVFVYGDFVGLDEVFAGDATVALTLEL